MKRQDVPQDRVDCYGDNCKALYAVDDAGDYVTVASSGWDAEQCVNAAAVAEFRRLAEEALARARDGCSAPLEYHMYARRMDVPLLAEAAGVWHWRLRRHLRPQVFAGLDERWRLRYADALGLTPQQLATLPP